MTGFGLTSFVPSSDNVIYNSCGLGWVAGPLRVATQVPRTLRCRGPWRTGGSKRKPLSRPICICVGRNSGGDKSTRVTQGNELLFVTLGGVSPAGKLPSCCSLTAPLAAWNIVPLCFLSRSGVGLRKGRFIYCSVESEGPQFHKQIGLQLGVLCHK